MSENHPAPEGEHITTGPVPHPETHAFPGGEHHGTVTLPFQEADWEEFHEEDRNMARIIVLLMAGIFIIGLCLYTVIALVAAG
jgi:hypothetical protein